MAFSLPQLPFSRREIIVFQRLGLYTYAGKRPTSEISANTSFAGENKENDGRSARTCGAH